MWAAVHTWTFYILHPIYVEFQGITRVLRQSGLDVRVRPPSSRVCDCASSADLAPGCSKRNWVRSLMACPPVRHIFSTLGAKFTLHLIAGAPRQDARVAADLWRGTSSYRLPTWRGRLPARDQLSGISHWRPFLSRKHPLCSPPCSLRVRASNTSSERMKGMGDAKLFWFYSTNTCSATPLPITFVTAVSLGFGG